MVENRVHLDVRVGTGPVGEERLAVLEAECARPVVFGAVRVRVLLADGGNESCLVMRDIEGNEFCLDWVGGIRLSPNVSHAHSYPRVARIGERRYHRHDDDSFRSKIGGPVRAR